MTEALLIALIVTVIVAALVILRSLRRAPARSELTEDRLRALLSEAPLRGSAATRPAPPQTVDIGALAEQSPNVRAELDSSRRALVDSRAQVQAMQAELSQAKAAALEATRAEQAASERAEAAAAEVSKLMTEATENDERLRRRAKAQAMADFDECRAALDRERGILAAERSRLTEEVTAALAAERAEVQAAAQRIEHAAASLALDQKRLAADRERLRQEDDDAARAWAKITSRQELLTQQNEELAARQEEVDARADDLQVQLATVEAELTRISGMTTEQARAELLASQEKQARRDAALLVRRIEADAEAVAQQRARAIVADSIQRVASDQTAQTVVSVVHLPAEEVKGRIIGREGRNIRTFETITGVNVIIDDTPEAVLLSCFDPVRREVGRITLETLIEDGRIHPHRIEEAHARAQEEVASRCRRAAQDALLEVGIANLHPELVKLLGHLRYRTSYGQNVLGHLVESAHIARAMAAELGIDPTIAARGAFLHDIGKALTHEAQGSHAIVGAELARKYGEADEIAHCIEAHHDEVPPTTVEAVLTQAADACSGGRPGARRESLESYVQRLDRIESIASAKKGVEKVFAMQAGRELRVMVKPEVVDDLEAQMLAREVAKQIEEELTYPGQVRVTVIRESRATEVAR